LADVVFDFYGKSPTRSCSYSLHPALSFSSHWNGDSYSDETDSYRIGTQERQSILDDSLCKSGYYIDTTDFIHERFLCQPNPSIPSIPLRNPRPHPSLSTSFRKRSLLMSIAWDKVSRAFLWTSFLLTLALCIQGKPPAYAQDGTSSANTVQGLYLKEALEEKDLAQIQAESQSNTTALGGQDLRIRELEKGFAQIDIELKIFFVLLTALMGGNIVITYSKKKVA
jgi:hypothetical protein